jgi:hypothetical protein
MKNIFIIILVASVAFISCEKPKCYKCETEAYEGFFCEGEQLYDIAEKSANGEVVWVSSSGKVIHCY